MVRLQREGRSPRSVCMEMMTLIAGVAQSERGKKRQATSRIAKNKMKYHLEFQEIVLMTCKGPKRERPSLRVPALNNLRAY